MSRKSVLVLAATLLVMGLASASYGALLVDFKPDPVSTSLDELGWTGSQLQDRPGLLGNGDGTLGINSQTPGGLNIQTPFNITGVIPGKWINTGSGSTTFYDVTLDLASDGDSFKANGPASLLNIMPGIDLVYQTLKPGVFKLWSSAADTSNDPLTRVLLLEGTITNAFIVGMQYSTTASLQSGNVTYTGGVIKDALFAAVGAGGLTGGSLSWSVLDIGNGAGGSLQVVGGGLQAFDADLTGQFNYLPEPATLCLMALGAVAVLVRRRKR
jgi:hypothetical protein